LVESEKKESLKTFLKKAETILSQSQKSFAIVSVSKPEVQLLTHQKIEIRFLKLNLTNPISIKGLKAVSINNLNRFPFPKTLKEYIENEVPQPC
jgi:hypothetical protein